MKGACQARLAALLVVAACAAPSLAAQASTGAVPGRTRVIVLGSGTPAADPARFGPAVVVLVDSTPYLFDAGVGVVRRWSAVAGRRLGGLGPGALRTLFLTHLHSDHTLGYPDLIFSSWTLEPAAPPLVVHGPPGIRTMTDHLLAAWEQDVGIRIGPGGENEGGSPPDVRVREVGPGVVYRDALVTVTAFGVAHGSWRHAFGYRIQTPDKVIVISGDATPTAAIAEHCRGCDILLHEGGFTSAADARPYFRRFHTTAEELARLAREASPALLVLYHQRPTDAAAERGYRRLRSLYPGAFVVADDLDVFH